MDKVDIQHCRMKCYQLTLPFPNTWKWVLFPCTSPSLEAWLTPLPAHLSGQPQHRFWHQLSSGPDHREHTDHRLLLWVPRKQRPLQEFLHPLCRGLRDVLGRLEAWNQRGSGHECLWVTHSVQCEFCHKYGKFSFSFSTRKKSIF